MTVELTEADRLALSLKMLDRLAHEPELGGWTGLGLAVQAYQKRAGAVIDWLASLAKALQRRFMVRLVKGAYAEPAHVAFPVKADTDRAYFDLACTMLQYAAQGKCLPIFGTHDIPLVERIVAVAPEP